MANKHELLGGKVDTSEVKTVDPARRGFTRMMRVKTITHHPEGRIAVIQLSLPKGKKDITLSIDEATARAIAAVFDDDLG
jgi:hypothetical protein